MNSAEKLDNTQDTSELLTGAIITRIFPDEYGDLQTARELIKRAIADLQPLVLSGDAPAALFLDLVQVDHLLEPLGDRLEEEVLGHAFLMGVE